MLSVLAKRVGIEESQVTTAEQLTQTETNDRVFTFRDQHGNQTLFDRITGKSCAVAYRCPMTGSEDNCDGADATQCPAC